MTPIDPNNTQAILIGASEFDSANKNFQNLPNVKTNLLELNRLLIDVVGIDKNQICMMLDKDNSSEITSKIIGVIPNALDTIIVYYAGHGIYRLPDFYLTTKKTQPKEPEYTGAIRAKDLVNLVIKKTKAKNIIFIIDCCFSARAKEGVDSRGKQVFFITAAPSTQAAKDESPENANYTAFTRELLVILENGIENAGEFLTFQDISNHLNKQLTGKDLPEPQLSAHGSPDKLGICKNQAYRQPIPKMVQPSPAQSLSGLSPSLMSKADIEDFFPEKPNELEWERNLPEINFDKATKDFVKQLQKDLKSGLSPVFLLPESNTMGGELFLRKIKNLLEGKLRKPYYLIEFSPYSKPNEFEILHKLACHVDIKLSNEQNWQAYANNIIHYMFKPLRNNSDVIIVELKNCHHLADDVLGWFVNDFWNIVESKLSTIPKNYMRVICVITADEKIKPTSEKVIELPLRHWKVKEIRKWLERHSNLDANSNYAEIAQKIYNCSKKGLPSEVCNQLKQHLTQV